MKFQANTTDKRNYKNSVLRENRSFDDKLDNIIASKSAVRHEEEKDGIDFNKDFEYLNR